MVVGYGTPSELTLVEDEEAIDAALQIELWHADALG